MSRLNLGARVALVLTATLAGLGGAAWFFPFPSAAQAVPDDPGISVVAGGQLLHRPALHNGKTVGHSGAGRHARQERRSTRRARGERS